MTNDTAVNGAGVYAGAADNSNENAVNEASTMPILLK